VLHDQTERIAILERGEADIIYDVPGEMIAQVKSNPKLLPAPVVSGEFLARIPGLSRPQEPLP
jgi:ABC-type transport system substrate-binding protein